MSRRIKLSLAVLIITAILMFPPFIDNHTDYEPSSHFDFDVATQWAPTFYQQISQDNWSDSIDYEADFISAVNYDGDWVADNNWDNLETFKNELAANIYFWTTENRHFIMIGYMVFHPRDWTNLKFDAEHENDAEGVFLLLRKGSNSLQLELMSTLAHGDLLHYAGESLSDIVDVDRSRILAGSIEFDPDLSVPVSYIESMGHGIYGKQEHLANTANDQFLPYIHDEHAELSAFDPNEIKPMSYSLLPISELWERRNDENLFTEDGYFKADRSGHCGRGAVDTVICTTQSAVPPWQWSQAQNYKGQIWYEPFSYYQEILNSLQ